MRVFARALSKRVINFSFAFIVAFSSLTAVMPFFVSEKAAAAPASGVFTVTGDTAAAENSEGWMFNRDVTTSTPFEFNADAAVLGNGSLYVKPISSAAASNKFIAENFLLSDMSDINTISFDYQIGPNGSASDNDQVYLNVYANFGESIPTKFYDCRYTLVASIASTSNFTTLTFDTNSAQQVTTRTGGQASPYTCPAVPSAMDSLSTGSSTIRAFAINVGDTTVGDEDVDAYIDNVVVASTSGTTTYDFEPVIPSCSADNTTFDTFTNGSVNGQGGWSSTGPFDQEIVTNDYGYSELGCKSLRISNAVTSGSFGNQTFSYSTANEAGESDALNGGLSSGARVNHYEAQFDFASASSDYQPGLFLSVSPDRGDGARMSYLGFEDTPGGINVTFYDVQGENTGHQVANFVETIVATGLSRDVVHTAKFAIDFVEGPSNDVVNIYIDGVLVHTGTTWENYYRFDTESQGSPHDENLENKSRTVDSLLFRVSGAAAPATAGLGYLIDNVLIATADTIAPIVGIGNQGSNTATPTIVGTVDDPTATVELTIDGIAYLAINNGDGTWSYTVTTPLTSGDHVLSVVATDAAGNSSTPSNAVLTISLPDESTPDPATEVDDEDEETTDDIEDQVVFQDINNEDLTDPDVQGEDTDTDTSSTDTDSDVEGDADEKDAGTIFGLAWYWWLLILAALGVIAWWIIGALRNRNTEQQ